MRIALVLASVLALAGSAAAKTIVVPKDQPTIQAAANAAATSDTILVLKGVYTENVTLSTAGVHLVGKGVVVDGTPGGVDGDCLTVNADDVVVQGITFRNGNNHIVVTGNRVQVLKCTFRDSANDAINVTGTDAVVNGCRFYGLGGDAADINGGDRALVTRNLVSRTGNRAFQVTGLDVVITSNVLVQIDDGPGMSVTGDNAVLTKNRISLSDTGGITITGNAADVEQNEGDRIDGPFLTITGIGALVQKNSASFTRGAISVTGDGAQVLSNKVSSCMSGNAITVVGDGITVTGNTIATTLDDAIGISVSSNTTAGTGTIQGNKVSDCAASAFNLSTVYNLQVVSNSAVKCTQDSRAAFTVVGDGNTLLKNVSTESDNKGFTISGNSNTVTSCIAKNALADGFRVSSGTGNTLATCVATGCGGEGLDNRGTGTVVQGGTYLKNRIDIANDVLGGATIPGGVSTAKFKTGGVTTQPEVD